MKNIRLMTAALLATALPTFAFAQTPDDPAALRDAALKDEIAWDIVEGLTTEVGSRLAGTETEARARQWAVTKLTALGFSNVRIEEFQMPVWVRGEEMGSVVSPYPQNLALTALGNSASTGEQGLEGELIYFPTLEALKTASANSLHGKIVFLDHAMNRTQDGSSYEAFGPARFSGPSVAAQKGAAAIVIRSVGTDSHRNPHTGVTDFEKGVKPIPAAALSNPDADNLFRMVKRGQAIRLRLKLTPRPVGRRTSGNVIAEVPGSDPSAGVVVVAGHLDSWDLGTGAVDDGAGIAIVAAAAKRIMVSGTPRRTIRVLWAGAEEVGAYGGDAYAATHGGEKHALVMESDFGADRVWQIEFNFPKAASGLRDRLAAAVAPLGIGKGKGEANGGADINALIKKGASVVDLRQDGTRYFDLHHTPDDTLDKIDPEQLAQNVAAWTAVLAIAANAPDKLGNE
ncbi:M20/M25/M40 family metallo-hydrolase [Rhizorhapis suberifaciens]